VSARVTDFILPYVVSRGAFYGTVVLIGVFLSLRQSTAFRRNYRWVLVASLGNALAMPFAYMWMTSFKLSYIDALTLSELHAGSWLVADGYCIFLGVVLARLVDFVAARPPTHKGDDQCD
jgi:hypothetical protein